MVITTFNGLSDYLSDLLALEKNCFEDNYWSIKTWQGLFSFHQLVLNLVFEQKLLIGYLVYSYLDREAELLRMGVSPTERGKLWGRKMLDNMISQLKGFNCQEIFLEVRTDNQPAIRLYKSFGFKEISIRKNYYNNPICDALIFKYLLSEI